MSYKLLKEKVIDSCVLKDGDYLTHFEFRTEESHLSCLLFPAGDGVWDRLMPAHAKRVDREQEVNVFQYVHLDQEQFHGQMISFAFLCLNDA